MSEFCDSLSFKLSPSSEVADVGALFDSYAVEVKKDGSTLLRVPLWMCDNAYPAAHTRAGLSFTRDGVSISLVQYAPPFDEEPGVTRKCATRWPFYVNAPLEVTIRLGGLQQWYVFSPGPRYGNDGTPVEPAA